MNIDELVAARKTIIEMLIDRGFEIPIDKQQISKANFVAMHDNNTINIFVSRAGYEPAKKVADDEATVEAEDEEDDAAAPAGETDDDDDGAAAENNEGEAEDDGEGEQDDDDDDDDEEEDVLEDIVDNAAEAQEGGEADEADAAADEVRDDSDVVLAADGHISQILPYDQRGGAHSKMTYVYFHISNSKFDKKRLVSQTEKIKETYGDDDINIIFVIQEATAPVLKEAEKEQYRNVEIFDFKSLRVNFSRNRIVPIHQLMTPEEITVVAVKYGMTEDDVYRDFPRIYTTDPMARYYGLREGDVCRIINRTTGEVEYCAIYKGLRGE